MYIEYLPDELDECVLVSEDNLQKEIMYISDDGLVIYTNINIINDEGSTNGTSLATSFVSLGAVDEALELLQEVKRRGGDELRHRAEVLEERIKTQTDPK